MARRVTWARTSFSARFEFSGVAVDSSTRKSSCLFASLSLDEIRVVLWGNLAGDWHKTCRGRMPGDLLALVGGVRQVVVEGQPGGAEPVLWLA